MRSASDIAALAALLALAACGGEPAGARAARVAARPAPTAAAPSDAGLDAAPADAGPALPALERIAERGASVAPGMREAARVDELAPFAREIVRAAERDTCARAAFAADGAVRAAFASGAGDVLTELPPASSGVVGTACARKGESIVLRVDAPDAGATRVHAVAWVSP